MLTSLPVFAESKYTSGLAPGDEVITRATETSCLKNREFIAGILEKYLIGPMAIFEVGSGTCVQTVYFSERFPSVTWQTSDREEYHAVIQAALQKTNLSKERLIEPVQFDIDDDEIPGTYDVVYASNIVHCIPWASAEQLFKKAATALKVDGLFIMYGPFNIKHPDHIDGLYTSEGNKKFDQKLRHQDPLLGLREIGEVTQLAERNGFAFEAKHDHTGVNNYILIYKKCVPIANRPSRG